MSRRSERLAEQAEFERDADGAMAERLNAETAALARRRVLTDDELCTVNNGPHSTWTSKQDGKRRCYYCCKVWP